MTKQEYQEWIKSLEEKGLDECEIEDLVNDLLDQPDNSDWFFRED